MKLLSRKKQLYFLFVTLLLISSYLVYHYNFFTGIAINTEDTNYTTLTTINEAIGGIEITRTDTREQLYYKTKPYQYKKPRDLADSWFTYEYAPESGDPVPEEVEVQWRKPPRSDQALYRGDIVGPYRIKLRSKIPDDVLKKIREPGYDLHIVFLVGKSPVTFCWRLGDYQSRPPSNFALQVGGTCLRHPYFANRKQNLHVKTQEEIDALTTTALPAHENWFVSEIKQRGIKNVHYFIPDTNSNFSKTVPEELEVSWETNDGILVGPFTLKVRSLIPKHILLEINGGYSHIDISINPNENPPTICWKLTKDGPQYSRRKTIKGGDC